MKFRFYLKSVFPFCCTAELVCLAQRASTVSHDLCKCESCTVIDTLHACHAVKTPLLKYTVELAIHQLTLKHIRANSSLFSKHHTVLGYQKARFPLQWSMGNHSALRHDATKVPTCCSPIKRCHGCQERGLTNNYLVERPSDCANRACPFVFDYANGAYQFILDFATTTMLVKRACPRSMLSPSQSITA